MALRYRGTSTRGREALVFSGYTSGLSHHFYAVGKNCPPRVLVRLPCGVVAYKTGGRLIPHARYFTRQLAESQLTRTLFRQMLACIERLAWHPT